MREDYTIAPIARPRGSYSGSPSPRPSFVTLLAICAGGTHGYGHTMDLGDDELPVNPVL